jgi:hypothetical protein
MGVMNGVLNSSNIGMSVNSTSVQPVSNQRSSRGSLSRWNNSTGFLSIDDNMDYNVITGIVTQSSNTTTEINSPHLIGAEGEN